MFILLSSGATAVCTEDLSPSWLDLHVGVPQGGIFSSSRRKIFINLLTKHLQYAYRLYADDLQQYSQARVKDLVRAVDEVNKNLQSINTWSTKLGLSVNPSKCQAITVGNKTHDKRLNTASISLIVFNGSAIPFSFVVKDLGLHIDSTLDRRAHVTHISQVIKNVPSVFPAS